jgi:hypothetical protein
MREGRDWTTDDPPSLGGLLSDAYRVAQLILDGPFEQNEPQNKKSSTWREHCDINMVMSATSLAPDGFLSI